MDNEMIRDFGFEFYNKYYAVYMGEVVDNKDPKSQARLRLAIPTIYGDDASEWAFSRGMPSGTQMGLYAIPNIGDLVWVSFENGDPRYPIWEYGPFTESPDVARRPTPDNYVLQSPKKQRLELDDGKNMVKLVGNKGASLKFSADGRISLKNDDEDLKTLLMDILTEIVNLDIITPSGAGTVGPTSMQAFLDLQKRVLKFLKNETN